MAHHTDIFIQLLYLLWDPLIVTAISIEWGEGQSLGNLTNFIPYPIGQLRVEDAPSLGAGLSSLEPNSTIDIFTILFSLTSYQLSQRTEVYFRFLPVTLLLRGLEFLSDLFSFVRSHKKLGFCVLYPLVRSHNRLRFSCYLSACHLVKRIGILHKALGFD